MCFTKKGELRNLPSPIPFSPTMCSGRRPGGGFLCPDSAATGRRTPQQAVERRDPRSRQRRGLHPIVFHASVRNGVYQRAGKMPRKRFSLYHPIRKRDWSEVSPVWFRTTNRGPLRAVEPASWRAARCCGSPDKNRPFGERKGRTPPVGRPRTYGRPPGKSTASAVFHHNEGM